MLRYPGKINRAFQLLPDQCHAIDRRGNRIKLEPAMVGDHNGIGTYLDGPVCIPGTLQPLMTKGLGTAPTAPVNVTVQSRTD